MGWWLTQFQRFSVGFALSPACVGIPLQQAFLHLVTLSSSLHRFLESGGVYKLVFGPKAFIVISDPVVVRYILKVGFV